MKKLKYTLLISAFPLLTLTGGSTAIASESNSMQISHAMKNTDAGTAAVQTSHKPWSMADKYYGAQTMAKARQALQHSAGETPMSFIMADRLESQITNGEDAFIWDAQGWYGTDENKLWIKTEGEYSFGNNKIEDAEIQALWSKPISAFWDVQTGLRYDFAPKGRTHLVAGVQGLAPYWFEVDAALFLSNKGDLTSRVEAEYDLLLNQRLILQPRAEVNFSAQDIPELSIGTGFTSLDLGLRLRYDIKREFAPYVGMEWQKTLGETADFVRTNGGATDKVVALFGLRVWY